MNERRKRLTDYNVILSDQWICQVCQAIDVDAGRVARLVIDAQASEILKIYITFLGGTELLNVDLPSVGFAVIHENAKDMVRTKALEEAVELVNRARLDVFGEPEEDLFVELAIKIEGLMRS